MGSSFTQLMVKKVGLGPGGFSNSRGALGSNNPFHKEISGIPNPVTR